MTASLCNRLFDVQNETDDSLEFFLKTYPICVPTDQRELPPFL
jgi:hypothetical protein